METEERLGAGPGALAVAITDALVRSEAIVAADGHYELGAAGPDVFGALGVSIDAACRARRLLAHPCLDWSERRHHLAGALGAGLVAATSERGWVSRHPTGRAVTLALLGCTLPSGHAPGATLSKVETG